MPHLDERRLSLSLVCPCFNEQSVVSVFLERTGAVIDSCNVDCEFIFVNDGSTDETLEVLLEARARDRRVRVIDLSRNFGKEAALTAGLDKATGDVVIPIDVDLQDPPELIPTLLEHYRAGYDVVLARRVDRTRDSFLKRKTAEWFYAVHNMISEISIPRDVGDYRLMSRSVVFAIKQLPENQRFMKGLFAWAGFRTAVVNYDREPRAAGRTKFNGWKLWNLALDGITSYSTVPLRIWFYIGGGIASVSLLYGLYIVVKTVMFGVDLPGYASLITVMLLLGGIQLMGIGILGEYLGRAYNEAKRRPVYIVEREY
jgi:polyisoprenyl-phosphate glycosyltransferase